MPKEKNIVVARSERLYLSPLKGEDVPCLVKWSNDPECFGHLRDMSYVYSAEEQRQWVIDINRDPSQKIFGIYYLSDDQIIGYGGFTHIHPEDYKAEVGMLIGEKHYWRRGLGKEARWLLCKYGFETLGLHNILGEHYANNPISLNNALKIGAKIIGIRRQSRKLGGEFLDVYYTDMLPHELIKPEVRKK